MRVGILGGLCALGAAVLIACGGDEGEGDDGFVAQADAICQQRLDAEPAQTETLADRGALLAIVDEKIANYGTEREKLGALEAPGGLAESYAAFLGTLDEFILYGDAVRKDNAAGNPPSAELAAEGARIRDEQAALADEIGFEVCGRGRYSASPPEPAAPLEQTLGALEDAIAGDDCELFADEVIVTSQKAVAPEICEFVFSDLKGFTADAARTEQYGETAAIVQYLNPGGDTISQPFVLEGDETFRMASYVFQDQPTIGTEPAPDAEYQETIDAAVEAISASDCRGLDGHYDSESYPSLDEACVNLVDRLGPAFDPAPEVSELGANEWFAFYSIETDAGAYYTAIVSHKDSNDSADGYLLSGVESAFR